MIVVDANVLIAHFSAGDEHRQAADTFLRRSVGDELRIHPFTLAEVLVRVGYTGPAERRRTEVHELGVRVWTPDEAEPVRLAKLRAQLSARLPDCCILSAALVLGASIATFDRQLARIATELEIPLALDDEQIGATPTSA